MFNFAISDEQQQLIDTARKFAAEHIIPVAGEYDESEKFPTEVFQKAFELEVTGKLDDPSQKKLIELHDGE